MDPVLVAICAIYGAFALGVLVGVRVDRDVQEYPEPLDISEPPSSVGGPRRLRAPFGVAPFDRPWDGDRDGWA